MMIEEQNLNQENMAGELEYKEWQFISNNNCFECTEAKLRLLLAASEAGHIDAISKIFDAYREYCLVANNYQRLQCDSDLISRGYSLLYKNADQGDVRAQYEMGVMYEHGLGVGEDIESALSWFQRAAENGNFEAQCKLVKIYSEKEQAPQYETLALDLYEEIMADPAVAMGSTMDGYVIKIKFGCEHGKNAIRFDFFHDMAEKGYACAQYVIGTKYYIGEDMLGHPSESLKDYSLAYKWLLKSAKQGYADAQCAVGWLYIEGSGVTQNNFLAFDWFSKAANQGSIEAQCNLGRMYELGNGIPQDYSLAEKWYRKAAEADLDVAFYNLGRLYERGQGIPQDYALAIEYYEESAERGHTEAMINLGRLYESGHGSPQNYEFAFQLYQDAAHIGSAEAEFNLARLYAQGHGVEQNNMEAFELLKESAWDGDISAQYILGMIFIEGRGLDRIASTQDFAQLDNH
jgi:TPR repeat protein